MKSPLSLPLAVTVILGHDGQPRWLRRVPGQRPSYDESLGEAGQNAAKAVEKALQKK